MKPAFKSEKALLADIESAQRNGISRIWWLGQSGFLLCAGNHAILFDPYLSDSLTRKYAGTDKPHTRVTERVIAPEHLRGIDVVTSSHNHTDHLDAETLIPLLAVNPRAKLVIPAANRDVVLARLGAVESRLVEVDAGKTAVLEDMQFTGIPAAHNEVETDDRGRCRFLGYVAQIGRETVYHSGDTLLHDGLAAALKNFSLDLALLPINGNRPERRVAGNMDGLEAAKLARAAGARLAIPHHFDMFEFNTASPAVFEAECRRLGQTYRVLRNGEGMDLEWALPSSAQPLPEARRTG